VVITQLSVSAKGIKNKEFPDPAKSGTEGPIQDLSLS
jgi:hypothetical protein